MRRDRGENREEPICAKGIERKVREICQKILKKKETGRGKKGPVRKEGGGPASRKRLYL